MKWKSIILGLGISVACTVAFLPLFILAVIYWGDGLASVKYLGICFGLIALDELTVPHRQRLIDKWESK